MREVVINGSMSALDGVFNKAFFHKSGLALILMNIFSADLKYRIGSKLIKYADYFILSRGDY